MNKLNVSTVSTLSSKQQLLQQQQDRRDVERTHIDAGCLVSSIQTCRVVATLRGLMLAGHRGVWLQQARRQSPYRRHKSMLKRTRASAHTRGAPFASHTRPLANDDAPRSPHTYCVSRMELWHRAGEVRGEELVPSYTHDLNTDMDKTCRELQRKRNLIRWRETKHMSTAPWRPPRRRTHVVLSRKVVERRRSIYITTRESVDSSIQLGQTATCQVGRINGITGQVWTHKDLGWIQAGDFALPLSCRSADHPCGEARCTEPADPHYGEVKSHYWDVSNIMLKVIAISSNRHYS